MNESAEIFRLQEALATCEQHARALNEALQDMSSLRLTPAMLDDLDKPTRRLLDQFAYRYLRLQDDMGARLMPAILLSLAEPVETMPAIDRYNRLEQLGWLPSAEEWGELRRIRNAFAHDYPDSAEQRLARLIVAIEAAGRVLAILTHLNQRIVERFKIHS
jgi:hypothetical protein